MARGKSGSRFSRRITRSANFPGLRILFKLGERRGVIQREFAYRRAHDFRQVRAGALQLSHDRSRASGCRFPSRIPRQNERREPSTPVSRNSNTSTSTGSSSTGLCFRASSCAGRPWIFLAEKAGGVCWIFPMNCAARDFELRGVERGGLVRPERFAIRIVGIGGKAETHRAGIALAAAGIESRQPRGAAERQHQHARGQRIERAKVPDLPESDQAAHGFDHVVRGFSARLIHHEHSVEGRRKRCSGMLRFRFFSRRPSCGRCDSEFAESFRQASSAIIFRLLHFAQKIVDVLAVFFRLIHHKQDFGRAPQVQALDQFVAHEFRGRS